MPYVIDRIEAGAAILEHTDTGEIREVGIKDLPTEAKEGDIVNETNGTYEIYYALTEQRRENLTNRMNDLFSKKKSLRKDKTND
jgi:hypothetical protein